MVDYGLRHPWNFATLIISYHQECGATMGQKSKHIAAKLKTEATGSGKPRQASVPRLCIGPCALPIRKSQRPTDTSKAARKDRLRGVLQERSSTESSSDEGESIYD